MPEINNLSSLLLSVVNRPSQQIVSAVIGLTVFSDRYHPNITVAEALLVHLNSHPEWKAHCLQHIGCSQSSSSDYGASIESLATASRLFLKIGDQIGAARCMRRSAEPHRLMGKYDEAEVLFRRAIKITSESEDVEEEAACWQDFGVLMTTKEEYPAALQHLTAARQAFRALGRTVNASICTEHISLIYIHQGHIDSAASELEAVQSQTGQSTRLLGVIRRRQGKPDLAEQLLERSQTMSRERGERFGLAECSRQYGYLRLDQGRLAEAATRFEIAHRMFAELGMREAVEDCREELDKLGVRS